MKNDTVMVSAGKDKGKKGKVLRVLADNKVIVEGVNRVKKNVRPTQENPKGGIVDVEAKIDASNLQLLCPRCGKQSRVGVKVLTGGEKKRICKKCQDII